MRPFAVLVLLAACALASCDKASMQQCDLGCRNYYTLQYWEWAETEIAAAPEAERAELRKQKAAELEGRMLKELDNCVMKCRSGADKHRVQCWIDAKTAREARKCANN